ncbi:2-oxoglutarate and iron-dependent oxygenase domain-containing protein [Marihabitans asiaticum]|uniref:Isopenicillin N synthase-like dioxygenase n=1 Tax=Marihabitans asiaticum TaxID=415218 RepID=A0A560WGR5_9MICO|nr:2-oxoglutarate and iron-dependent oxygenase domain-containing protein [Marihabitans asiaticum]TWD16857.1 isopenicillin N synthase-like dioxygenase [Marihabitans asiaticum]
MPGTPSSTFAPALPVLDLSRARREDATTFRADLLAAARDVGFFYLVGHGVPAATTDRLLQAAREFFALPLSEKQAIENLRSPHFRGWTRLGGELTQGRQDWREQIDFGIERDPRPATKDEPWNILEGPNQWPAAHPALREVVHQWQHALTGIAEELLSQWAVALGQDASIFAPAFAEPSSLIKIICYPGRDKADQGVGAHTDSGVLTLLLLEPGSVGLQVRRDGTWVDVEPVEGAFVVNIGELLEVATDGLLRATAHRVVSPPAGSTRISVPFFYNPSLSAQIPTLQLPDDLAAQAPGVTQDALDVLHSTYGGNALKSRLRAHPDVAERHHRHLLAS